MPRARPTMATAAKPGDLISRRKAYRRLNFMAIPSVWPVWCSRANDGSSDHDRRAERPEVGGHVGDGARDRLQIAEGAHVLHREQLQAEAGLRFEFPAAAEHHGERFLVV